MVKIEVEVSDQVIRKFGIEAFKERLQRTVRLEELAILAEEINAQLNEAGVDYLTLAEKARQEAWEEFKATYLKDILK